jgi:hypothetical protein
MSWCHQYRTARDSVLECLDVDMYKTRVASRAQREYARRGSFRFRGVG